MRIETYEQRVLVPDEGMWLYNAEARAISDKVCLGKDADASAWVEITDEVKQRLEAEWKAAQEGAE